MRGRTVLPVGPVLTQRAVARLPLAAGRYRIASYLKPVRFSDYGDYGNHGIVTAIYLITDDRGRIRWLGQTSRNSDLVGRLAEHHRDPAKRSVFAAVRVLHLLDHTPPQVLNVIEGTCADWLDIRGKMTPRKWPRSGGWPQLVA